MVVWAIRAEHQGAGARRLDMNQVTTGNFLERGGEGAVYKGEFEGQEVAVKKIPLYGLDWKMMNSLRHVLRVSHFAATFSRHICQMKGYCANDDELWCVLRH